MQDSRVGSKIGFCAWVIVLALLAGCATTPQGASDEEDIRYWPPLPEQPRYLYEATLRGSRDIEQANQDALMAALIKGETLPDRRMAKPLALAVRAGRIYVTDSVMNLVHVFDLGRRRYFQMGVRFEGRLADPRGIWVGEQSRNVYVVDQGSKRVVVYDELGLYLRELSLADTVRPVDVAVDESRQRIYVLDGGGIDSDTHRVQVFSLEGHPIRTFGTRGREVGQFNLPLALALTPDGNLAVLDAGNFRVQVLTPEGKMVRTFGSAGNGLGQFSRPRDIAVDEKGLIYVSDASFSNVQVFSPEGTLLLPLGGRHSLIDKNGHWALVAGIATDETGRLYVLDQAHRKIEVFRALSESEGRAIMQAQQP